MITKVIGFMAFLGFLAALMGGIFTGASSLIVIGVVGVIASIAGMYFVEVD